jgi:hypothetical protein
MPSSGLPTTHGRLDFLDGVNVDGRTVPTFAESEHAGTVTRWEVGSRGGTDPHKPRPDASIIVDVNPWGRAVNRLSAILGA